MTDEMYVLQNVKTAQIIHVLHNSRVVGTHKTDGSISVRVMPQNPSYTEIEACN
jgi:hypothetical protein